MVNVFYGISTAALAGGDRRANSLRNRTKVLCRNFSGVLSKLYRTSQAASKATEAWLGYTWAVILSSPPRIISLIKKITASQHPTGVRGGCSPQNKSVYKQYRCQSSLPRKDRRVSAWLRGIYLHLCIGSTHYPIADAHRGDGKRFVAFSGNYRGPRKRPMRQ